jgi:tRNA nucleotidyltransferase (CCA-adding enzyme)
MLAMYKEVDVPLKKRLHSLLVRMPIINEVADAIRARGGHAYLVGGAVRDLVLGLPLKDVDIEVHNLSLDALASLLQEYGSVDYVGKTYGVLKLKDPRRAHIDWSVPRRDKAGRKPEVEIDTSLDIKTALARRDLTMNAMAIDIHELALIDPFDGLVDIEQKVLRCIDPDVFVEDPLRFYRIMQFIGRFDMLPDEQLRRVCKSMDISNVARERIEDECAKLLLKSFWPSRGIRWIAEIGRLQEILPELYTTTKTDQGALWHP